MKIQTASLSFLGRVRFAGRELPEGYAGTPSRQKHLEQPEARHERAALRRCGALDDHNHARFATSLRVPPAPDLLWRFFFLSRGGSLNYPPPIPSPHRRGASASFAPDPLPPPEPVVDPKLLAALARQHGAIKRKQHAPGCVPP